MKNKTALIIISLGLIIGIGIVFMSNSKESSNNSNINSESVSNIIIKDGVQYVTINAKGGYTPRESIVKSGIPTKLVVKTNGTYDCSASLVIKALGYQKILSRTGEETIDLGVQKAGTPITGVCGMGMYSFVINFE